MVPSISDTTASYGCKVACAEALCTVGSSKAATVGAATGIEATSTGAGMVEVVGAAKAGGVALSSGFESEEVSSSFVGSMAEDDSLASATSVAESVLMTLDTGAGALLLLFLRLGAALGVGVVGATAVPCALALDRDRVRTMVAGSGWLNASK